MRAGSGWLLRLADDADPAAGAPAPTVAVKDAIDVAGTVTTVGARSREDSGAAAADAPCVAVMRRAGARIVGKTNLSELCWFADGINEHTGTPVNPIDPRRIPGGSSSGSAVVVALGQADVALGTDTGGSVRIPAACCGVAGLKTTWGRVSREGVFPLSPGLDTVGPLARDVAGLARAMRLLEPGFAVPPLPAGRSPVLLRLRFADDVGVDPAVQAAVDEAVAATGWQVHDRYVDGWRAAVRAAARILDAEAGVAQGFLLDRPHLLSGRARENIERSLAERPADVARARDLLAALERDLVRSMASVGAVALALPTLVGPPPLLEAPRAISLTMLTVPFNVLGWPAVSVPAHDLRSAARGTGVVPPSVQLAAPRGEDGLLLALAARLPSQVPFSPGPPR